MIPQTKLDPAVSFVYKNWMRFHWFIVFPSVQKGEEEWNIINGYFRGVSVHRHRFAPASRAGSVLSVCWTRMTFYMFGFFKKGLYLLYSLPLRSASFEWVLKKFPAFSPTQLARVECSYQFNARTLEMREQPWFGACSKFRLGFGSFSILALLEFGS